MAEGVLDASAIMAVVRDEPGAEFVAGFLPGGLVSTVNLSEVVAKAVDARPDGADDAWRNLMLLRLTIVEFDANLACRAGALRAATRKQGLSFADRACLALAAREALPAVTADRRWAGLDIGIEVRLLR